MNKKNKTDLVSIIILIIAIVILFSLLFTVLSWINGMQTISHNQKMEELQLEKEIALINNSVEIKNYSFDMPLYNITQKLRTSAEIFCKEKGARIGYYSLGPGGNYGNCNYGGDVWKEFSSKDYTEWLEIRLNKQRSS